MSSQDESKSEKALKKEEKDDNASEVHSANCWERADLGDDERRQKFLRLMGASKKEHHGRFVIGDQDKVGTQARDKAKTDELNKELESQYQYSQEHKITRFSHTGLGFGDKKDEESEKNEEKKDDSEKSTQDEKKDSKPEETSGDTGTDKKEGADRKRESTEPVKEEDVPAKKPKMMMSFVKASDSS